MRRLIRNVAGEEEVDHRGRRSNLLEGLGVITFTLVLLWPIAYVGDVLGGNVWITRLVHQAILLMAIWIFILSPLWHSDTPGSWGLGDPKALLAILFGKKESDKRLLLCLIVGSLFVALNLLNYLQWPEVAEALKLHKMGFETDPRIWNESFPGRFPVIGAGLLISSIAVGVLIRYDNFGMAFLAGMRIWLPLLALIFFAAWLHRGASAFSKLSLFEWLLGVVAYVFWGAFQQLVFCGFLGTRFRRGFAPADSESNLVPVEKRIFVTLSFGISILILGLAAIAGVIVRVYGREHLNSGSFIWIAAILFIGGLAYGRWYCLDKKRLLVATLSGACFGLIHIDSYGLVTLTWVLGTILSYTFMKDANRNVFALGFIHGILGSTLSSLFSKSESGALEIDYHVGPWNVDEPTWGVLIFPVSCILVLGIAIFRVAWSKDKRVWSST